MRNFGPLHLRRRMISVCYRLPSYDTGQIDALLDFGSDIIVLEFKASLLRDETKHKRDR